MNLSDKLDNRSFIFHYLLFCFIFFNLLIILLKIIRFSQLTLRILYNVNENALKLYLNSVSISSETENMFSRIMANEDVFYRSEQRDTPDLTVQQKRFSSDFIELNCSPNDLI